MAGAPGSTAEQWRDAVRRCARLLLVMSLAGLLGSCGGGGSEDGQRGGPNNTADGAADPNTATLGWNNVVTVSLAGYRIYYGTSPGVYLQSYGNGLDAGKVTSFLVTGLKNGTRYYFVATAYDTMGNESVYSNEVFKDIP